MLKILLHPCPCRAVADAEERLWQQPGISTSYQDERPWSGTTQNYSKEEEASGALTVTVWLYTALPQAQESIGRCTVNGCLVGWGLTHCCGPPLTQFTLLSFLTKFAVRTEGHVVLCVCFCLEGDVEIHSDPATPVCTRRGTAHANCHVGLPTLVFQSPALTLRQIVLSTG